jgi:undecaprenyl diphosphate synthase
MTVILAIGYGGQEEIARAVCALAKTGKDMTQVTREDIVSSLETARFPPPDMIVRTGGHMRHSGYFLFQSPYAEYYFSPLNWPEFDATELDRVIQSYDERVRKFGK